MNPYRLYQVKNYESEENISNDYASQKSRVNYIFKMTTLYHVKLNEREKIKHVSYATIEARPIIRHVV